MHYCTDCYHAWQEGGYGAVQASIDAKRKPTLDKHECVGTAQLAEKDVQITALQAEVAEYAAFEAEVLELYTFRYRDQVKQPDPNTLLERIRFDHMVAATARTAMNRDGVQLVADTTLLARANCTIHWLRDLQKRLGSRAAIEDNLRATVQDLEYKLADMLGKCCHAHQCQPSPRMHRAVNATPHPSASKSVPEPSKQQLDRIESLSKQAATNGPGGWPFAAFLVGAIVAYFIK